MCGCPANTKIERLRAVPNKLLHALLFCLLLLSVMKYVYALHLPICHSGKYLCELMNVKVLSISPVLCIYVSYAAETSQTQSHITAGGLSASLSWCQTRIGTQYQIFVTVRQLRFCWCGALSLIRGRVCRFLRSKSVLHIYMYVKHT
jgi:hypothetical protein